MPAPPIFQRAPRIYPELPQGKVEIPPPLALLAKPSVSLWSILLPGVFALGTIAASVVTLTAQSKYSTIAFVSLGFTIISSITSVISYISQKRAFGRAVQEQHGKYDALLAARRQELSRLRDQQQVALRQIDPDPKECLARVERLDRHLWERTPQAPDFLSVRIGVGQRPSVVAVEAPRQEPTLAFDPLIQAAQDLATEFAQVADVPISLSLGVAGVAGVAGSRAAVLNAVCALAIQIATHHSPDEVKIVALFPADEAEAWTWLRWLPHVWTEDRSHRFLACDKDSAHHLLMSFYDLLIRRRMQTAGRETVGAQLGPQYVFFLADKALIENEPIESLLLEEGKSLGALSIFLADRIDALPKNCQAIVEFGMGQARLIQAAPSPVQILFNPDVVQSDRKQRPSATVLTDPTKRISKGKEASPVYWAELPDRLARSMAPIRLTTRGRAAGIPSAVPLLDLLSAGTVEDLNVLSRWRASTPHRTLAVPIGKRAGGELLMLDLHERGQGPHGLVAGATGSGKSELLQSIICSLAVHFHPHVVAFLLVDYKGGGMANAFLGLPHVIGTITNLQGNLAMRALASLRAELQRRQRLFDQVGVNHIDNYQQLYCQGSIREPLPHLVLIVDEFAELKAEQPDFMRELISAVRVGRSLGVHLVLATQKPAGVVDEQIWANSRFRICLRVERPEDSQEVLKRPDAANLIQSGRGYFQVGNNEVFELFQAAWSGAAYVPGGVITLDSHEILEVALDGSRCSLRPSPKLSPPQTSNTHLQAVVSHLGDVAHREGIQRLPGPWLPPLPDRITLDDVRLAEGWDGQSWVSNPTWLEPVVGMVDNPMQQRQGPLRLNLKDGHLAVYGAPGTGKTTFIQTLVSSLALSYSPQDVQLYLLDFGGRLLTLFAPLPQVGAVVLADEVERVNRLLRFLLQEMEVRKERFTLAGVNTLPSYRNTTSEHLPAIVVVLDTYTGLVSTYPDVEDTLVQIAREGGNLGIHLVLTATSPSLVKARISGNIALAVALQLTDRGEYGAAIGRLGGLEPASVPGRGAIKGNPPLEFQTALPIRGDTEADRTNALKALVEAMSQAWSGTRPRPIPVLPNVIPLSHVLQPLDRWPAPPADGSLAVPVGLEVDNLEPLTVDLNDGPHFLITGPVQSGKTTLLQTWLLALAEQLPPSRLHLYLVDMRRAGLLSLIRLPHVQACLEDDNQLDKALKEIAQALRLRRLALDEARHAAGGQLDERSWLVNYPAIVVAIDDFDTYRDGIQGGTKECLEQMARRERGLGLHVLLAGSSGDIESAWDGLVKSLKELQTGFLLGSSAHNDLQLFNLRLPIGEAGRLLPPGQGYYAHRGLYRKFRAATTQVGEIRLAAWVEKVRQRST